MTQVESLMLAVCFGATVGFLLSNIVFIATDCIRRFKEKKRNSDKK